MDHAPVEHEAADRGFAPHTAEQVQDRLDAHPPRSPSRWRRLLPLVPTGFGLGAYLAVPSVLTGLVLMVAVAGGVGWSMWRLRQASVRQRELRRLHESAMLRRYDTALRKAWELLPDVVEEGGAYASLVLTMGRCLGELKRDDAALVCFDRMLKLTPERHPARPQLEVLRAVSALFDDRLAEADDAIRKLRESAPAGQSAEPGGALAGGAAFARMLQSARTYRVDDLIDDAHATIERLRPMGIDAAFGYALTAWAHSQRADHPRNDDDPATLRDRAAAWWDRATTLLPEAALIHRLPECAAFAGAGASEEGRAA